MFFLLRGGDRRSSFSSLRKDKSVLRAVIFSFWCFLGHFFFGPRHPIRLERVFGELRIGEELGKRAHYAFFKWFGELEMTLFLRTKPFLYKS